MTKTTSFRRPVKKTRLGTQTLRVRLSLRQTQAEFAQNFRVSQTTVYNWERGHVRHMQKIYKEILDALQLQLQREGKLIPEELVDVIFREAEPSAVVAGS